MTDTRNESENIASNYNLTIDKWGNLLLLYVDEPAEFEDYEINYEYDKLNNWTFYSQSGRTFEYDTTKKEFLSIRQHLIGYQLIIVGLLKAYFLRTYL